jgi:hypothetical protein
MYFFREAASFNKHIKIVRYRSLGRSALLRAPYVNRYA